MAESAQAKFSRYLRRDFTPGEARAIIGYLVADKVIDIATFGALNRLTGKAAVSAVTRLLPFTLRAAAPIVGSVAGSLGRAAVGAAVPLATNPYVVGTALGLGALQTQPGQELLEAAAESGAGHRRSLDVALFNIQAQAEEKVKRTKSKFNSAVSKGMKAIKSSTSYGKKGVINAPKKAFKAVVGIASKLSKAKKKKLKLPKPPKVGVTRIIYKSMIGLFR